MAPNDAAEPATGNNDAAEPTLTTTGSLSPRNAGIIKQEPQQDKISTQNGDGNSKSADNSPSVKPVEAGVGSATVTTGQIIAATDNDGAEKSSKLIGLVPERPPLPPPSDYLLNKRGRGSLTLEPNPFEQSFATPTTTSASASATKLPPVAALTSPHSQVPDQGSSSFNWGVQSLRTGPLSPAMLSGPANAEDYFGESHSSIRQGYPTPNESSLRTGLTPGGSGSMFSAPSPGTSQLFTPGTLEFQRAALSAASRSQHQRLPAPTSQPFLPPAQSGPHRAQQPQQPQQQQQQQDTKPPGLFDNHDNDAANGLYLLAQGRNGGPPVARFPPATTSQPNTVPTASMAPPPPMHASPPLQNNAQMTYPSGSARGVSEAVSVASEDVAQNRPGRNNKRKATSSANAGGRAKGETSAKSNKRARTSTQSDIKTDEGMSDVEDQPEQTDGHSNNKTLTEDEKRRNFLERNRIAALKCRQRKKQWLANLQSKVELYSQENDSLTAQITALREEVVNLKTLLLAHKDCPVTQQQGLGQAFVPPTSSMDPGFNGVNPQMAASYPLSNVPMSSQQVISGPAVERRFP